MSNLKIIVKEKMEDVFDLNKKDFSEKNLRKISDWLRFLFIDDGGNLQKLKNNIGEETIYIKSMNSLLEDDSATFFQQAGGNKNGKMSVAGMQVYDRALSKKEIENLYKKQKAKMEDKEKIKLSKFLKQTCFIKDDLKINKEEVIKFVANKLGGIHYDEDRSFSGKKLEAKYKKLDEIIDNYEVLEENPIYIELMSIAQDLCNSKDFKNFYKKL